MNRQGAFAVLGAEERPRPSFGRLVRVAFGLYLRLFLVVALVAAPTVLAARVVDEVARSIGLGEFQAQLLLTVWDVIGVGVETVTAGVVAGVVLNAMSASPRPTLLVLRDAIRRVGALLTGPVAAGVAVPVYGLGLMGMSLSRFGDLFGWTGWLALPLVIAFTWGAVSVSLFPAIIVDTHSGASRAARRSVELVRGSWWALCLAILLLGSPAASMWLFYLVRTRGALETVDSVERWATVPLAVIALSWGATVAAVFYDARRGYGHSSSNSD